MTPKETELRMLAKCVQVIGERLGDTEAIVQIRKGQIRPGRQVFHYFKVDIATLDPSLSKPPSNRHSLIVEFNQDSIESPSVNPPNWIPWDQVYGD
jgi:hypothetical protein